MSGVWNIVYFFFFQAEDGIRDVAVTGVQTCALPISLPAEIQACQSCHGDITASFEKTPHWKTMNDTRGGHAMQGCEACHGPGGDHADDPSKSSLFDFKKATSEDITERCLTCHASGSEHMSASNSFHRQNDVSCTSCHSMRSEEHT